MTIGDPWFRTALISSILAGVLLLGCRSAEEQPSTPRQPTESAEYDPHYEQEIEHIFDLARDKKWERARQEAAALYARAPDNRMVARIYNWIQQEAERRRAKAVEDEIRDISSQDTAFNPTIKSLLTEGKNRGLPPKRDVREAVEDIEDRRYVPESYGQTTREEQELYTVDEAPGRIAEVLDRKIEVHLDNAPLEEIIYDIGRREGINFGMDKAVSDGKHLSVQMEEVPLREFLDFVSRNMDVDFQIGEDLIWIVEAGDGSDSGIEKVRFFQLEHGLVRQAAFGDSRRKVTEETNRNDDTVTTIEEFEYDMFVQDGAPQNPYLEQAIRQFFGEDYLIDYERNLVMARGSHQELELLDRIIEHFDRPVRQVLIEARFVTVTKPMFLELGALWETGRGLLSADPRLPEDFTGVADDIGVTPSLGLQETFTNVLGRANLSATLKALEQSGESRTLSAPRVALINNRPATISDGKVQYYYEQYTVEQTVTDRGATSTLVPEGTPQKITSGASMDVLASIGTQSDTILLALHPEVNSDVELTTFATVTDFNEQGDVISTFDIRLPESRTQSMETRLKVRSGETVVLGGVLERRQSTFVDAVPILGNLPIIGAAFRKRTEIDSPRYLLIFVTASIISEAGEFVTFDEHRETFENSRIPPQLDAEISASEPPSSSEEAESEEASPEPEDRPEGNP